MKMRYLSHDYASQSYSTIIEQNFFNCTNRSNTVHTCVRVTHYMIFGRHNSPHHFTYYQISYNLIINIITSNMPYQIQYLYLYINTTISIFKYCYHIVTILTSTLYSYIYQYNISIKIYNNQYRYNYTDSITGMIINNIGMNNHTVYSYHNYTIINTIIIYSNFLSAYHSYLPLKQRIIKLYKI